MAGRARVDASGARSEARGSRGSARGRAPVEPLPSGIRVALFGALLLLALYVLFVAFRMHDATGPSPQSLQAAQVAGRLVGQADRQMAVLRTALAAAIDARRRIGGEPLDAAETGLAATQGAAQAVALASDGDILGQTGAVEGAGAQAWREAAQAASRSGKAFWAGSVKDGGKSYYAAVVGPPGSGPLSEAAS